MANGSQDEESVVERPNKVVQPEQTSPAPASLELLKLQLETEHVSDAEHLRRLQETMDRAYGAEAAALLRRIETVGEPTKEAKTILIDGTAILLAEAAATGQVIDSAQALIDAYRHDKSSANQEFAESLVRILRDDTSALSRWYKNEGWTQAKEDAQDFLGGVEAAQAVIAEEQEDAEEKKEAAEKDKNGKKTFLEEHKSDLGTAVMLGAAGLVAWYAIHKIFEKKDEGKPDDAKTGLGAKVALTALGGAVIAGQLMGIKDVQEWISKGDRKSWIYQPWARGWTDFVDLEMGNAFDYWTGNGPSGSERSQFETMAGIFDVSESIIWADSKVSYGDFMAGESGTINPFHKDEEEKIRTKLKDYYKDDLERIMPELKDPEKAKNVKLKDVLMKGFAAGVIRDKDTTGMSEDDREAVDKRFDDDQTKLDSTRKMMDKPEENLDGLQDMSAELVGNIEQLEASIDQYWGDMGIAFEDAIGVDFDFGSDNEGEYRDLKIARDKFMAFFEDHAKTDKEFFRQKKMRVKAFMVFLEKHKKEDPWTDATKEKFADYKEDILDIQQKALTARRLAEQENLTKMREDAANITLEDLQQGLVLGCLSLNGAWDYLQFRYEKVIEGNTFYIALTVAQVGGVASEFIGQPAYQGNWAKTNLCYRIVKGTTWNISGKPLIASVKFGGDALKAVRAFQYSADELTARLLKGQMTLEEVKTRIRWATKLKAWYEYERLPDWRIFADIKSGRMKAMEDLVTLERQLGNLQILTDWADGKVPIDQIHSSGVQEFIRTIPVETVKEVQTYRVLARLQNEGGGVFDEVLGKLKNPNATLSTEAQAAYERLQLRAEDKAFLKEYLNEEKGNAVVTEIRKIKVETAMAAEYVTSTGAGDAQAHIYDYGAERYELKQSEIAERATRIAAEDRVAGRLPLEGETQAWHDANWKKAIDQLCYERYSNPVRTSGNTWRMAGRDFTIPETEIRAKMTADTALTEEQAAKRICLEKVTALTDVEAVVVAGGKYRYKIGGQWLEFEHAMKPSEVKAKFQAVLGEKMPDFEKFVAQAKSMKYFAAFERVIGTAAAVWTIYHLETATDKRKATAEIAAGIGSFYAGMKLTDWTIGKRRSPGQRLIIDLLGGLAGVYFGSESIESIVSNYYEKIPASYAVSGEFAAIIEKQAARSLIRTTMHSMEKGLVKIGVEKLGMKGLTKLLEKRVSSIFLKRIAKIAARRGFQEVLTFLGVRGIVVAALLADDATVIGVADDIIAAGMLIWMGKDIYDILKLVSNAVELQKQMEERQTHDIAKYEIRGAKARAEFQEKLTYHGCTIENAHEKLDEQTFFDIIRGIDNVTLVIEREDTLGHEEWILHQGEAVGMSVFNEDGTVLCEMADEDAKKLDEDLAKAEPAVETESE